MSAAVVLSKAAAAAAWRRLGRTAAASGEVCTAVQHALALASKGAQNSSEAALLPSNQIAGPSTFRSRSALGQQQFRTYHSHAPRLTAVPVKCMRATGCFDDDILSIHDFVQRFPLFRRLTNHPLIPGEEEVWELTLAGQQFFWSIGVLAEYNAKLRVSILPCLEDVTMLAVSTKFCSVQLSKHAEGWMFDGGFVNTGLTFKGISKLANALIKKYYPQVKLPKDFSDYLTKLRNAAPYPSAEDAECMVYSAALLSTEGYRSLIINGSTYFRGKRYSFDSLSILRQYGEAKSGTNGDKISDLVAKDPLLSCSARIIAKREQENPLSRRVPETPLEFLAEVGRKSISGQRDLFVHGGDPSTRNDPDVVAFLAKRENQLYYTSDHVAEYQRWYLETSATALQVSFAAVSSKSLSLHKPDLGIKNLFPYQVTVVEER